MDENPTTPPQNDGSRASSQPTGGQSPNGASGAYQMPNAGYGAQPNNAYGAPQYAQYAPSGYVSGYTYTTPTNSPVSAPPKRHGWIVAIVVTVCVSLLLAFGIQSCSSAMSSWGGTGTAGSASPNSIAVITIDGTIQYDNTSCSPEGLKYLLDKAADDDNIKGVVLRINSGGGTATAGEEMAEYVKEFSEQKPIVVSSASVNASAAYEVSSQADYIYVAKTSEVGAIGTAMQVTDLSGLLDKLGIDVSTITSASSKDSTYGLRELTDEERVYYQHIVDQINETFIENVADGRGMSVDEVRSLANGLVYTGLDAVENGLADEIGTREDAIDKVAELAGLSTYDVYTLEIDSNELSNLLDAVSESESCDTSEIDMESLIRSVKVGTGSVE